MPVLVVGSLNEDAVATVDRLPGRGETVVATAVTVAPGGKGANQAAAAGRLGGGVAMLGRVGADPAGDRQRTALTEAGVDVALVRSTPGELTGTATIAVEAVGGENLIVVVPGANAVLAPEDVDVAEVREATVVLLQLETPLGTVRAAATAATGLVVLNPAPARPLPADLLALVDVLVPNEHELARLAGRTGGERSCAELAGLARGLSAGSVVVTLGGRGALVVPAEGEAVLQAPPPVQPVDTTGAGDCFCGALAQGLAHGEPLTGAVRYAVAAAAASTTGTGARGALPDDARVRALLVRLPEAVPVS